MLCKNKDSCMKCDRKDVCEILSGLIGKSKLPENEAEKILKEVLEEAKELESKRVEINKFATSVVEGVYRIVDNDSKATYIIKELVNKFFAYLAFKNPDHCDKAIVGLMVSFIPLLPDSIKSAIGSVIEASNPNNTPQSRTPDGEIIN